MRFSSLLLKMSELPYRFRGKYRKVKKPTFSDLVKMRADLEREERNMLILRHPYLTIEQSENHMKGSKISVKDLFEKWNAPKIEKYSKHITITDRLNHLRVKEEWD